MFVWQKTPAPNPTQIAPPSRTVSNIVGDVFKTPTPASVLSVKQQPNKSSWLTQLFSSPSKTTIQSPNIPTPAVTERRLDISPPPIVTVPPKIQEQAVAQAEQKEEVLEEKLQVLKKELENKTETGARILELQKQLTEVLTQKDKMEQEIIAFRKQASAPPTGASHVATPTQMTSGPTVKIITPEGSIKAGLPRLTTFPNVVTGITKDSENNFLPGVLITVKDKDDVPLRALKTNRLGQFAASTPLANGVYFVEIEDPRGRFTFDRIQITLNGSIVPALEIIAKSQKKLPEQNSKKNYSGIQHHDSTHHSH